MAVATLSGGMLNVSLQMVNLVVDRGKRVTADLTSVIKPVGNVDKTIFYG